VIRAAALLAFWLFAVTCAFGSSALADSTDQRSIDPTRLTAQFSIEHIFVEHVTGTVPIVSGSVTLEAGSLIPTSATALLDASKLLTGDPDRDASLGSADYFDTRKFPTWVFASTAIQPLGPAAFGTDGLLTIHGVTQPEHLDVSVHAQGDALVYHAVGHIDRHAFGMRGTRLDPVIGDAADVTLDIVVLKDEPLP
jgi:polyisoprenoid-binding protein YceI